MAENKEGQEKTEEASGKRIADAHERGQFAKSMDVTTAAVLLIGGLAVFLFASQFTDKYRGFVIYTLHNMTDFNITDDSIYHRFIEIVLFMAEILLPIMGVILFVGTAAEIAQVGFNFASKKFTEGMRWEQVFNPFSGLRKIFFSQNSLVELIKSVAKLGLLGIVVWSVLRNKDAEIIGLLERPFIDVGTFMIKTSIEMVWKVGVAYILIAFADYFYQRYRFAEDLKMTKQEVKEENKQSEGDPRVKSRMRQLMRGRLRKIMLQNVPKADVVIANPTHFAVAISYKSGEMSAPKVVAKGVDFLALRIREIAENNNVPVIENPPLARAIYFNSDVDDEIPENLFRAVAQVLAYVYSLKKAV